MSAIWLTPTAKRWHRFAIECNFRSLHPHAYWFAIESEDCTAVESNKTLRWFSAQLAMALSGEVAAAFSCGRKPAGSNDTMHMEPRSGDSEAAIEQQRVVPFVFVLDELER